MAEVQVTRWREIPSMVTARDGDDVVKVQLPARFQEAIENYESIMDAQPDPQTGCARRFAFYQPHS